MSLEKSSVPRLIGQKYANVIIACLTGLKSENGVSESLEDENGIIVGTRYILEIVKKLEEICL
jgi:hypothetical protein